MRAVMRGVVLGSVPTIGGGCHSAPERASPPIVEAAADGDVAIAERFAWLVGAWVS